MEMADNLGLDYDEIVILKEVNVAHGGTMAIYTDELILTNKKIICLGKGVFGGTKKVYHYPLDQIKVFNGAPQVMQGKLSNGTLSLDIYLVNGEEHFNFQTGNKRKISAWIEEIRKLFGKGTGVVHSQDGNDVDEVDDDTISDAFKEMGREFKSVGREFADAFGVKGKKNKTDGKSKAKNNCPSCGKSFAPGSRFCPSCGTPIGGQKDAGTIKQTDVSLKREIVCPSCGKKLGSGLRFCTECGTEIKPLSADDSGINYDKTPEKEKLGIDQQIELLQKLKSLVDTGVISQEEFEKKKKEIF